MDLVRSAVTALAELDVATQHVELVTAVWMDGSLATPLISVASALAAVPDQAAPRSITH